MGLLADEEADFVFVLPLLLALVPLELLLALLLPDFSADLVVLLLFLAAGGDAGEAAAAGGGGRGGGGVYFQDVISSLMAASVVRSAGVFPSLSEKVIHKQKEGIDGGRTFSQSVQLITRRAGCSSGASPLTRWAWRDCCGTPKEA